MRQRVRDDGVHVTLDMHGLSVREAESRLRRAIEVAAERGRASIRAIHGSSTSDRIDRNPTIKHLIEDLVEAGSLPGITTSFPAEDTTTLALPVGRARDPRRIQLDDIL